MLVAKSTAPIKFGTDGWRALISDEFTFGNVRVCTEAVCRLLKEQGLADQGLILGYDTRFNSQEFATEVARTAAGNGVKTYFSTEATPTPVVSFNVTSMKAGGAIIISASHNPGEWNGFKYNGFCARLLNQFGINDRSRSYTQFWTKSCY